MSADYCIGDYAVVRMTDTHFHSKDYAKAHAQMLTVAKLFPNEHVLLVEVRNQRIAIPEVHTVSSS